MSRRTTPYLPLLLLALALGGCSEDHLPTGPLPDGSAARAGPPDVVVRPGESIQAALDAASPSDRIFVAPGTYAEAIIIDKPGIHLIGLGTHPDSRGSGRVVIENPGGHMHGIHATADGVEIRSLTVRGFDRNGIFVQGVDGFLLADIVAEDNGAYGLYPRGSRNGVIERSVASGHADTGIYVGLSEDVVIRNSTAFGNVIGFEITNSSGIEAVHNEAYGNTVGLLVALLPFRSVKVSDDVLLAHNRVRANNLANFAAGGFEEVVPAGSGILVLGGTNIRVRDNVVSDHEFVGIAVGSVGLLAALAGLDPAALDVEPDPHGSRIVDNAATGNGGAQPIPFLPPGVDLLWDGSGTGNCWMGNEYDSSLPSSLPLCL